MRARLLGAVLMVSCLLLVLSCGSDDDGGPTPLTGVEISPEKDTIEIGHTAGITATVSGGSNKNLTWYVNGIEDGNAVYGTITQNSAATYQAPDSLPDPATITIVAFSVEDDSMADTCTVHLQFTKIFVNSGTGNDNTGSGCVNLPVKTITKGLTLAEAGMTVLVFPGLYDVHNGEIFRLDIPRDVALVGMNWETCIILGHGLEDYYETVWMKDPGASFRKFTLEMGDPGEPEWDLAIRVEDDNQLVDSIRIFERGDYAVLRITSTNNTVVQNCHFVVEDGEAYSKAYEIAGANTDFILRNCTASGFSDGVFINGTQEPLIEGCSLTGNRYGLQMWYQPPSSDPNPDLGGGARGSAGGNTITGNSVCGLNNLSSNTIYAKFNYWNSSPPVEGVDYCNTGTGSVVTE